MAQKFLEKNKYEIIKKNYFAGKSGEIDLIAKKENILHFVEVKARTNKSFGWPEESVSKTKLKKIVLCAQDYLLKNELDNLWQIDVVAVCLNLKSRQAKLWLIKNIYIDN